MAKQVSMAVEMLYRWIRACDEGCFLLYWSGGGHDNVRDAARSFGARILGVPSCSPGGPVATVGEEFPDQSILGANSSE